MNNRFLVIANIKPALTYQLKTGTKIWKQTGDTSAQVLKFMPISSYHCLFPHITAYAIFSFINSKM